MNDLILQLFLYIFFIPALILGCEINQKTSNTFLQEIEIAQIRCKMPNPYTLDLSGYFFEQYKSEQIHAIIQLIKQNKKISSMNL